MDVVPVADHGERQQEKCDQQQPRRFRGIHRMAMLLLRSFVRHLRGAHAHIVAPRESGRRPDTRSPVLHYGVVHACAAK